jgi:histidine ammonia-lyase
MSPSTETVYQQIRNVAPYHADDTLWGQEIDKVKDLVSRQQLLMGE